MKKLILILGVFLLSAGLRAQSFKVLVVASRAKDHLKMIAAARPVLEQMAKDNGFALDFTDDTSRISDAGLAGYQVFVMLHLAPFDMSYSQQAALQKFVEQGKGWVGIHAAGLTGRQFLGTGTRYWQWFEDFMGGVTYSPHPAYQKGTVLVEDHNHPATRHLPPTFDISDEWYEFNKSPRSTVRVLASADESTYHQNRPMGDHPIVWTNERYRRMIYIGVGHDPSVFGNESYLRLVRDAIVWAGSNDYSYEKVIPSSLGFDRARQWLAGGLPDSGSSLITADRAAGRLSGTGTFRVATGDSGNYYQVTFDIDIRVTDSNYSFHASHFYEKPVEKGITNAFSKIEYRWWDYWHGHPWSSEDSALFKGIDRNISAFTASLASGGRRFRVLALYENGGHHVAFSARARTWLDQLALDSNFAIDYIQNTDKIDEAYLSNYQLILQLDYAPYAWKDKAVDAFQQYIEQGRGGWVGFHHATLLGEFDGYPMWQWFSTFMGGIRWKNYIPGFAQGEVRVEDTLHPVMKGVPSTFTIPKEEWYTYDKSPRGQVHVIANVDESSYTPSSAVKMGDHPIIWTNEQYKARNVYIFMGHSPVLFDNEAYKKIVSNAICWAAKTAPPHFFKAVAFYSTTVEPDHVDFARDAIQFYSDLAVRRHFVFDTTSDWANMNDDFLKNYQEVLWLNDFPKTQPQRAAFEKYMTGGGAWLGFHVSGYNDKDTHWPWFVRFLGGSVFYTNSWPPLPATLVVDSSNHSVTRGLPSSYVSPLNEWYAWKPSPRENKDVKVLLTLDTSNYPLGKKDRIPGGDVPVAWTNTRYNMVYMNMGHGDHIFTSSTQNRLFENAILWLGAPKIYVNQVGFDKDGPKTAVVSAGGFTTFNLVDAGSGKVVYTGALSAPQRLDEWDPGKLFYQADFSSFKSPGRYRLSLGDYSSEPFTIEENALARLTIPSIIHYYHKQRANTPQELAADAHMRLFGSDKTVDIRGGWCDASGDVSKYFSHLAYANFMSPQQTPLVVWSMESADESIPGLLTKWGIKDSLEKEALYGADYLMRALSKDDYFYMIVFSYFNKDPNARRIVRLLANSVTTDQYQAAFREGGGMAIAALARIARWKKYGAFTSEEYLSAAQRAFAHLLVNNTRYDDDGKENIIDDYCALMAATELWIATDSALYREQARLRMHHLEARMTPLGYFIADDNHRPFWHASDAGLPVIALSRFLDKEKDRGERQRALAVIRKALDYNLRVTRRVSNPFGYARQTFLYHGAVQDGFFIPHDNETGWWWQGENARLASLATAALVGGRWVNSGRVSDSLARYAAQQLSWILGGNPYSVCFMYGFGYSNTPYMQSNFGHGSEIGGISNGITGVHADGSGIEYKPHDEGNEWRWTEQWIPHAAWFLQAVAAMARENR
ncbi:ThuA domain-containing protein [Dinghuibacter silviterrae]|nr:ThuA domain-containing protein [Dinghuibacter silviterrae]